MAPVGDSSDFENDFELIQITVPDWSRVVRGALTLAKLRGFFGVLGNYLKEVKRRASVLGL
jgi:hypothetical protein